VSETNDAKKPSQAESESDKAKKRGESPEEIAKLLLQIEKAEKAAQTAYTEWIACKDETKAAKGRYDIAISDLRSLVRSRERWKEEAKRQPLLNQKQQNLPAVDMSGDWRKLGIDKLAGIVTDKDRDKLGQASIYTLGDLQDLMQKHGGFWFQNVTGVGRAAADRIENEFNALMVLVANEKKEAEKPASV